VTKISARRKQRMCIVRHGLLMSQSKLCASRQLSFVFSSNAHKG